MAMDRIEVITSVERRRRWSAAEKARLVAAMDEPGAVVTEIARRVGVETSLLYRWRRQFAVERTAPAFVPLQIEAEPSQTSLSADCVCSPAPSPTAPPASIAISFGEQVRVTVEGAPDATTLANVIGALTAGGRFR
jgi:transposase